MDQAPKTSVLHFKPKRFTFIHPQRLERFIELFRRLFRLFVRVDERLQPFHILFLVAFSRFHAERILIGKALAKLRFAVVQIGHRRFLRRISCQRSCMRRIFFFHAVRASGIEHPQERIVVEHRFTRVARCHAVAADHIRQIQIQHIIKTFAREFEKLFLNQTLVAHAVVVLFEIEQGRQNSKRRTFSTVIPPSRDKDVFQPCFFASRHCFFHILNRITVERRKACPSPNPARKPQIAAKLLMRGNHFVVMFEFIAVIIPVNQGNAFGCGV